MAPLEREAQRDRRVAIAAFLLAPAALAGAIAIVVRTGDAPIALLPLAGSVVLGIAFFALLGAGMTAAHDAGRLRRLARGHGVIARWHVGEDAWRDACARREADPTRRDVPMHPLPPVPREGFDMVLGADGLFVGHAARLPLHDEFGPRVRVHGGWLELDWPETVSQPPMVAVPVGDDPSIADGLARSHGARR